jgi:hypothetical protein
MQIALPTDINRSTVWLVRLFQSNRVKRDRGSSVFDNGSKNRSSIVLRITRSYS